jgi:capsule polysaccharide export protein KpsC/LpsZ
MKSRINGTGGSRLYYSAQGDTELGLDDEMTVVGMFTNLLWDASLEVEDCPFNDVLTFIRKTINTIINLDNTELIIKTHPAEEVRGTNESVVEWIDDQFHTLPSSVSILPPDTDTSTYTLLGDLDSVIVYNSTVGLEASYLGTPVVTAGETHYRNLGITHDPQTEREYTELIEDVSNLHMTTEMRSRAVRYLYYLFYQDHITFPFISFDNDEFRPASKERFSSIENIFDTVVEKCIKGDPVLSPSVQS